MGNYAKVVRNTKKLNLEINAVLLKLLENLIYERAGKQPRYDEEELLNNLQDLRIEQLSVIESVSDEVAAQKPRLFEEWNGRAYQKGERVTEAGTVYRAKQDITPNQSWRPSATPTLWEPLAGSGEAGTLSNPITAAVGMTYIAGKYYSENGTKYLCKRQGATDGDEFTLYYLPSQLIGHYFEVVNE